MRDLIVTIALLLWAILAACFDDSIKRKLQYNNIELEEY